MKKILLFTLVAWIATLVSYSQQKGILWSEDFEGDWTVNWHVDAGTWEVGVPTSGPNASHSGQKLAATVLAGNYSEPVSTRLIRHTSFVVPAASENPRLRFYSWFSFSSGDYGEVQIKVGGAEWLTISNRLDNQGGDSWSYGSIDLSQYAGSTVQVGFYFYSAQTGIYSNVSTGWYIDDVSLVTGPYILSIPEDFETGFDDWSADEGSWEVGAPTVGPVSAHGGQNCAGTNLEGNYQEPAEGRLVSPPFVVPAASENPRFRYYNWFSFSASDYGEVQIKVGNTEWNSISNRYNNLGSDSWSYGSIDLSQYEGSTVQIGFYFYSVQAGIYSNVSTGWYIDDVSLVTGPYILSIPEDFETGFDDWSADEGSWEVGAPTVGPVSAHGGQNCAGTNLEGNYQEPAEGRLVSPPFVVPSASQNPAIRFWHWFNFSAGDYGELQISLDGGTTWTSISSQFINTSSGTWSPFYASLSPFANKKVQLAFYFYSIQVGIYANVSSGWYIDDINFDDVIGITEDSFQKMKIYPNPFSDKTTVEFNNMDLSGYKLSVLSISGSIVFEKEIITSGKIEIEKGSLPAGIYIIELKGEKVFRHKIIIE